MKIGLLGRGTVGGGVDKIISSSAAQTKELEVTKILDLKKIEGDGRFKDSIDDIVQDESIDVVVECMGGIEPAHEFILASLNAGKHVVTSNKAVVSKFFFDFVSAANKNDVGLFLEATAGGGVPWIHNLMRAKRIDEIIEYSGIINGTSNFIIDRMEKRKANFEATLKQAQERGYAEADPSADIDGDDVKAKTMISASIAFDTLCTDQIPMAGIRNLKAEDINVFDKMGLNVRMITKGVRDGDKYCITVEPQLCDKASLEANTPGYFNTVSLRGETIGELKFFGAGAGEFPTANAIVQDIIDCMQGYRPKYNFDRQLVFDASIMQSSYVYRTSAKDVIPQSSVEINENYFLVANQNPMSANDILRRALEVDSESFMAGLNYEF